ncbi:MAG TPA: Calx-beta domain-containing protein [Pyrinomonadaceae bacterium]|nr:Calx-beta domain-containing protein [Pyrinomonadaceae bacterium]
MFLPRRFSPAGRTTARAPKTFLFTLAAALACGLLLYTSANPAGAAVAAAPTPLTGLVNVTTTGASSWQGAGSASITPDGRYVVFVSSSPDLAVNDFNSPFLNLDVFVRDRRAGRTLLVSANAAGTAPAQGASFAPVISADGRYVAFVSNATDLVSPDPGGDGFQNVYRRDLLTNQTVLVSQTPAGRRGNGSSSSLGGFGIMTPNLSISADGRYVSFVSTASDLVSGDTNNQQDAFVRDVQQGVTRLVSVNEAGTASGNRSTAYALMTPSGRFVAFVSSATDLTPKVTPPGSQVYLRDLQAGTTKLVSANRIDGSANNSSSDSQQQGDIDVSDDGRFVAFVSEAPDLVAGDNNGRGDEGQDVFVRDTVAGTTHLVSVNRDGTGSGRGPSGGLSMTPDGRFVVFISSADDIVAGDTNKVQDVFVRDLQAGTTAVVTADTGGAPAGIQNPVCDGSLGSGSTTLFNASQRPAISADGRFVTFVSSAAGLSATPDTNCLASPPGNQDGYDIFVRDVQAGATRLASVNRTGEAAGAHRSSSTSITPDGRYVLFSSNADDLVAHDTNGQGDLFVNVNLPAAGQVRFAQQAFTVPESAGQAVVTVTRTPGATGPATVAYTTLPGGTATAAAGGDTALAAGTLSFAAGEESKQFTVPVLDDATDEADETVFLKLTDEAGGSVGEPAHAAIVIADDDPSPRLTVSDARVGEGDSGGPDVTFLVTLSEPSPRTITLNVATQNGTATGGTFAAPGVDYEPLQGTYTFPPGTTRGLLRVRVSPDTLAEPDETFSVVFSNPTAVEIEDGVGVGTIVDDDGATFTKVRLTASAYTVAEAAGRLDVEVTRSGDLLAPSSVGYFSIPFSINLSPRTDYTEPAGVVRFAPGESKKTLTVFITDDALREENEQFMLILFEPEGCTLGAPHFATVTIQSDDAADGPSPARQEGSTAFFVRQHYRDFLGRDPDAEGLAFWTGEIESCGSDQQCREAKRIHVSAAFFLSIEFQETGYLAYKSFKAAYGNLQGKPVPIQLFWFLHDAQYLGRNVVVNQGDWRGQLEQNKRDYFDHFARSEVFNLAYPASLAPAEFVAALDANAGSVLTAGERAELAAALSSGAKTRAEVLRAVAENAELSRRELNRAFVLMEYFGYLRRNPDDFPDLNFAGYNFWLGKLEEFGGNYINAEMVKAFISSDEYLKRFGQ